MNREEIRALLTMEINLKLNEVVDALAEFESNPNALTFRDAENISDKLISQALDAAIGQVVQAAAKNVESDSTVKKTAATTDGGKSASN